MAFGWKIRKYDNSTFLLTTLFFLETVNAPFTHTVSIVIQQYQKTITVTTLLHIYK